MSTGFREIAAAVVRAAELRDDLRVTS
jgi:hypothetical protein